MQIIHVQMPQVRDSGSGPSSPGPVLGFVSAPRQGQETESHREDQRGNAAEPTTLRWPVMSQYLVPVDRCRNTDHSCRRPEAVDVSRHRSPANSRSCSNGTRARFGFRVPTLCRLAAASALLVHLASQQTRRTSSFLIFGNLELEILSHNCTPTGYVYFSKKGKIAPAAATAELLMQPLVLRAVRRSRELGACHVHLKIPGHSLVLQSVAASMCLRVQAPAASLLAASPLWPLGQCLLSGSDSLLV